MKKAIPKTRGGKRPGAGRPATGKDPVVTIRLPVETIAGLDEMAGGRGRRSAFIRQMIDSHLQSFRRTRPPSRRATAKSSAMAAEQIDRLQHGKAGTPEEREGRKRRLLKGPKEFRDMRAPKVKG
jgi:hypothetical protein